MKNKIEKNKKHGNPPRILGRIDDLTWKRWKDHAAKCGYTFSDWVTQSIEMRIKADYQTD